ncbi:MAG: C40 family peptidase [Gemmatimonadota bacterium]|nr:C40 family peptidase [Gemmatimonadota bacterium]
MSEAILIVSASIAPLQAEPRAGSEQVSQRLAGHRLEPLEVRSPWLRVRGSDGYEGWVHSGYAHTLSAREAAARYRVGRVSLGCVVREADGMRRSLPIGAILADDAVVEIGTALPPADLIQRFPRAADAVVATAVDMFAGAPYQWGGITPWGADCSGFVQTVFALHGVAVPRDARQQAQRGADAGRDLTRLRPADLLFFSDHPDGRITHVGIATGEVATRIVHISLGRGGYATEDVGARDDPYAAELVARFRFARRVRIAE